MDPRSPDQTTDPGPGAGGRAQPLLPGRWRPAALALVVLSVLGLTALGWHYHGQQGPGRFDLAVYQRIGWVGEQHEPALWRLSQLGGPLMLVLGTVGLTLLARRTGRRAAVWLALLAPAAAVLVTKLLLKPWIGRELSGEYALPSGHTTSVSALAAVTVLLAVAGGRVSRPVAALVSVGTALAVFAVAFSMTATYRHYVTDTVAGVLVSVGVVAAVALLLDRGPLARGRSARGPTRTPAA